LARGSVLPTGKVPADVLKRVVLKRLGVQSSRVLVGPRVGEDATILDMGDRVLVLKTSPITGAVRNIGWLVIHINANDIAVCGARPMWFLNTILLPEGADEALLREIMADMDRAARGLGVAIVGGHTETVAGLSRPILVGFMISETLKDSYVATCNAQIGDSLILTKGAGIEGTSVLAEDLAEVLREKISEEVLLRARRFIDSISVVDEAMKAAQTGGVHSMHTPTEGGVLNGIWEMAEASQKGVTIYKERIRVAPETKAICDAFGIDPLKMLGSGALLIAAERGKAGEIVSALKEAGIEASIIGEVTPLEEGRWVLCEDGSMEDLLPQDQDHVYKVLDKYGMGKPLA
jgi:hydrogenase expression/formation protein HypE